MPRGFQLPTDAASMLDVAAPLAPAPPPPPAPDSPPHLVVVPPLVDPSVRAAPAPQADAPAPELPAQPPATAWDQPAEPALAAAPDAASSPLAEAVAGIEQVPSGSPSIPAWCAPRMALVVAAFALAWQLVAYYASQLLPLRVAAGLTLDNFDALVGSLPVVGSAAAPLLGTAFGLLSLGLVLVGARRGVREPVLQGTIAVVAACAATASIVIPRLVG